MWAQKPMPEPRGGYRAISLIECSGLGRYLLTCNRPDLTFPYWTQTARNTIIKKGNDFTTRDLQIPYDPRYLCSDSRRVVPIASHTRAEYAEYPFLGLEQEMPISYFLEEKAAPCKQPTWSRFLSSFLVFLSAILFLHSFSFN
jgi:hypothetical protein